MNWGFATIRLLAWVLILLALGLSLASFSHYFVPLLVASIAGAVAAALAVVGLRLSSSRRRHSWAILGVAMVVLASITPRLWLAGHDDREREALRASRSGVCEARVDWFNKEVRIGQDIYRLRPCTDHEDDMPSLEVLVGPTRRGTVVFTKDGWVGGPAYVAAILNAPCQQLSLPPNMRQPTEPPLKRQ